MSMALNELQHAMRTWKCVSTDHFAKFLLQTGASLCVQTQKSCCKSKQKFSKCHTCVHLENTDRQTDRQTYGQRGRQTKRQPNNQTDRQTDKQTNKQAHHQTSKQTATESYGQCAGSSMDQHFLTSYYHAALSVVLGQFGIKGFADGPEGIVRLVEASPFIKASQDRLPSSLCQCAYFACTY